jgi:hypothetical protein
MEMGVNRGRIRGANADLCSFNMAAAEKFIDAFTGLWECPYWRFGRRDSYIWIYARSGFGLDGVGGMEGLICRL